MSPCWMGWGEYGGDACVLDVVFTVSDVVFILCVYFHTR